MTLFFFILVTTALMSLARTDPKNVISSSPDEDLRSFRAPPCPDEVAIDPCICSSVNNDTSYIVMDCTNVENEEQLQTVFLADFPTREYQSFYMKYNRNLTRLGDVFQGTTFRIVTLTDVVIEVITEDCFIASADTLQKLVIGKSMLNSTSFPFDTISSYSKLTLLEIAHSKLDSFPIMNSESLSELWLQQNEIIGLLPATAFINLPNLAEINIYGNFITEVEPGTFSSLPALHTLSMFSNLVSVVRAGTFSVSADVNIGLSSNIITAIEPGAFSRVSNDVRMSITLSGNFMTEIVEYVWTDVLAYNETYLSLRSNPLVCGCDIAWLLSDPIALSRVDSLTNCQDGRLLTELDPAEYTHC